MSSTDRKLHRVFLTAGSRQFSSKNQLAKEIFDRRYDEFSSEKDDERVYMQIPAIAEYVSFCVMIGLLTSDLKPYVDTKDSTWRGFELALGEKVEDFAAAKGFTIDRVRSVVRDLLDQKPARLPTPKAVFHLIKPDCVYHIFYKSVTVQSYQERVKVFVRSRQTFIIDDILKDPNVA